MTTGRRMALFAVGAVIAVVGFILIKPDESSQKQGAEPAVESTQQTETSARADTQPEQPPSPPPIQNVRIKNGKPVGGVQRLEFVKGETVEFAVTSDVADHVHVHGYDLMEDVTPGKTVKFRFKGDIDGQFEIELEDRAEEIATLKVAP